MGDLFARVWENLGGRVGGPMTFRLVLQPAMAAFFAIRSGIADARANRSPYFWAVLHQPEHRRELIREGWKSIARIFGFAILMDAIYQITVLGWFYPGEALIVAFLLACVPYLLLRGLVGRLARRIIRPQKVKAL